MKKRIKNLHIFDTSFGPADEARVDEWEMMAAQRALDNFHTLLKDKG